MPFITPILVAQHKQIVISMVVVGSGGGGSHVLTGQSLGWHYNVTSH